MSLPQDAFIRPSPARAEFYVKRVEELETTIAMLVELLKEVLPHVEATANALSTGPVAGPTDHLVNDITTVLARLTGEGR